MRKILDSLNDQENVPCEQQVLAKPLDQIEEQEPNQEFSKPNLFFGIENRVQEKKKTTGSNEVTKSNVTTAAAKRAAPAALESETVPNVAKKSKPNRPKTSTKKEAKSKVKPLAKGQKTLTSFFRI